MAFSLVRKRILRSLFPSLLLALYLLQCGWFIRSQSFTNDEPEHIVAGVEAWRFGEFKHWHDQPPLARLLFTLPVLDQHLQYAIRDDQVRPISPRAENWLTGTRWMNAMLGVALLASIWAAARRLFSEGAANFTLALAALSPDLIAHFSQATIDGAGCLLVFLTALLSLRYWRSPTWGRAVALGMALGGLLLAKFNSPPLFLLSIVMVLVRSSLGIKVHPFRLRWVRAGAVLSLACFLAWAGYFFHVSRVSFLGNTITIHFSGYTKMLAYDAPFKLWPVTFFLPACEWFTGLGMVTYHDMEGHRSFLAGHYSNHGFPLYFPLGVLLKWPIEVLFLGLAGGVVAACRVIPRRRDLFWLSIFPAVYFLLATAAHIDIGIRHVLPVYPFLLLYAGAAWEAARSMRWSKLALGAILVAQAADISRYAPDYLSYFSILIRPENTWRYMSDSNTDWGQGMYALREYQAAHGNETVRLAYVGEVDPAWYGIRYIPLREEDRLSGTVVVSATHLSGQLLKNHNAYRWLLQYPVSAILGHSLYVFEVPASTRSSSVASAAPVKQDSHDPH